MKDLGNYVCEGQMNIFDFLYETPEADKLRADGWKNMYDETPPAGFYEVCDINKPNRIWVMECNEDGSWWNPNALRISWWRPLSYKSDGEIYREAILHGPGFAGGKKRIIDFFASEYDDKKRIEFLKNEYGVGGWTTDYGCVDHNAGGLDFSYKEEYKQANKHAKIVHSGWPMVAKEIGYLIQRGIYTADIKSVTESVSREDEYKESVSEPIAAASEPKKCCGVTPWLKKSRCVQWDANKPRYYMMAYICPKCGKIAVDNIGWPKHGYGTFEDAAGQALEIWNDKNAVFEIKDYNDPKNNNYIHLLYGEEDEWEKLYGQKYDDYKRPIIQKANEEKM